MRNNSNDKTLKKNYIQKYQYLIGEYEQIKRKEHAQYKTVGEFYKAHGTCRQIFLKYYARYKQGGDDVALLLPGKRGPKYQFRRISSEIEELILEARERGCGKYEIHSILKAQLGHKTPSPSGIYNVLARNNKNKLTVKMKEEKQRIIKDKAGEMGHIDCHHLSKDMILGNKNKYYLVGVMDDCTRIVWVEVLEDIKSLTVMFGALRCFNYIANDYDIKFAEMLSDNGPEFGPRGSKNKGNHPFERMLIEMGIKHRYTRPYRPQTNGKIERFWRTLNEDLIEGTDFDNIEEFKEQLVQYLLYYNKMRPHQGLNGQTPLIFANSCQRIT